MKTAGRENQNRLGTVPGNRVYGAAGQNRSHLISWAAKQEKIQPAEISFFLTPPFIELTGKVATSTASPRPMHSHGQPQGGGIHEKKAKTGQVEPLENQARTARLGARQVCRAGEPSIS